MTRLRWIGLALALVVAIPGPSGAASRPGTIDRTFGKPRGYVLTHFGDRSAVSRPGSIFPVDARRFVAVGSSGHHDDTAFAVARYWNDGRLDTSFGRGGKVLIPLGTNGDWRIGQIGSVALGGVDSHGRITIAGMFYVHGTPTVYAPRVPATRMRVPVDAWVQIVTARLRSDGTLDTSYGGRSSGLSWLAMPGTGTAEQTQLIGAGVGRAGDVVVAVQTTTTPWATFQPAASASIMIANFHSDGQHNFFRDGTGWVYVPTPEGASYKAMLYRRDGRIALVGSNGMFTIRVFNPNGTPDASFGKGGLWVDPGTNGYPTTIAEAPDGSMLVGGMWDTGYPATSQDPRYAILRVDRVGVRDQGFGGNGFVLGPKGDQGHTTVTSITATGHRIYAVIAGKYVVAHDDRDGRRVWKSDALPGDLTSAFTLPGKMIVAGARNDQFQVVRLNRDP